MRRKEDLTPTTKKDRQRLQQEAKWKEVITSHQSLYNAAVANTARGDETAIAGRGRLVNDVGELSSVPVNAFVRNNPNLPLEVMGESIKAYAAKDLWSVKSPAGRAIRLEGTMTLQEVRILLRAYNLSGENFTREELEAIEGLKPFGLPGKLHDSRRELAILLREKRAAFLPEPDAKGIRGMEPGAQLDASRKVVDVSYEAVEKGNIDAMNAWDTLEGELGELFPDVEITKKLIAEVIEESFKLARKRLPKGQTDFPEKREIQLDDIRALVYVAKLDGRERTTEQILETEGANAEDIEGLLRTVRRRLGKAAIGYKDWKGR